MVIILIKDLYYVNNVKAHADFVQQILFVMNVFLDII